MAAAKWMLCERCQRPWPFPVVRSPHTDDQIEYVCAVCLEAEVASLRRTVATMQVAVDALTRDE